MDSKLLKNFSEDLVKLREEKEITLEQISHSTRIDIKYLKAIEDSNFEVMPEVYMRAFLKGYAKALDLEGEEVLKKFDLAKSGKIEEPEVKDTIETKEQASTPQLEKPPVKEFGSPEVNETPQNQQKKSNSGLIFGITLIVIAILIAVYFIFIQKNNAKIVTEKSFSEVLEEKPRFEAEEETVPEPEKVSAIPDSLDLRFVAKDTCWIKLLADGITVEEFMLYPNRTKNVKALNKFNVLLGNANGISFELNGEEIKLDNMRGRVPNIEITRTGSNLLKEEIDFPNE